MMSIVSKIFILSQRRLFCTLILGVIAGLSITARAQTIECEVVAERDDLLQIAHCKQCGESSEHGRESSVELQGQYRIPDFATNATVFQNGWRLTYKSGAHKITAVAAAVQEIKRGGKDLFWQSVGVLRDQNFDDSFEYCGYATVISWNKNTLSALADHSQSDDHFGTIKAETSVESGSVDGSALTRLKFVRSNPASPRNLPQPIAAVLPRAFELRFTSRDFFPACFDPAGDPLVSEHCKDDNDLLQIAVHRDHAEGFHARGTEGNVDGFSRIDTQVLSWTTYGILKDNDARRDYLFRYEASTFGGEDIRVFQPTYSISPKDDLTACIGPSNPGVLITEEIIVENIPFREAIPVLSGWELGYACHDDDVKDIGIWIEGFSYEAPGTVVDTRGTLRYRISRVLRDASASESFISTHNVDILGFKPIIETLAPPDGPIQPLSGD